MRINICSNNGLTGRVRFIIRGKFLWSNYCSLRCLWSCHCRFRCLAWLLWNNGLSCCLRSADIFYDLISSVLAASRWLSWNRNRLSIHCVCDYWLGGLCLLLTISRNNYLLTRLTSLLIWSSISLLSYFWLSLRVTLNNWLGINLSWGCCLASLLGINWARSSWWYVCRNINNISWTLYWSWVWLDIWLLLINFNLSLKEILLSITQINS